LGEQSDVSLSTRMRSRAPMPRAMRFAALSLVPGHRAMFGGARQADEGAAAHVRQLLMAGQIPFIAWFAIKWVPRTPTGGMLVLGLQLLAGLAAATPVFLLRL